MGWEVRGLSGVVGREGGSTGSEVDVHRNIRVRIGLEEEVLESDQHERDSLGFSGSKRTGDRDECRSGASGVDPSVTGTRARSARDGDEVRGGAARGAAHQFERGPRLGRQASLGPPAHHRQLAVPPPRPCRHACYPKVLTLTPLIISHYSISHELLHLPQCYIKPRRILTLISFHVTIENYGSISEKISRST